MDIQTYLNFGIFFALVFVWFAGAQIYVARMMTRIPGTVALLGDVLVPELLKHQQLIAYNMIKVQVVPVWKKWAGTIKSQSLTNNLFCGITLLASAMWMKGIASLVTCSVIGIITVISVVQVIVLRQRQKLTENGFDMVYNTVVSLNREKDDGIVLTDEQVETKTATLNMLNDESYWKQMIQLRQPETI